MSDQTSTATGAQQIIDPEEIRRQLAEYSRQPFREVLTTYLEAQPDVDSVRAAAKKSPDRYMQSLTMGGKLAGYSDKVEINATIHSIHQLSDMELARRLRELDELDAKVVDTGSESKSESK